MPLWSPGLADGSCPFQPANKAETNEVPSPASQALDGPARQAGRTRAHFQDQKRVRIQRKHLPSISLSRQSQRIIVSLKIHYHLHPALSWKLSALTRAALRARMLNTAPDGCGAPGLLNKCHYYAHALITPASLEGARVLVRSSLTENPSLPGHLASRDGCALQMGLGGAANALGTQREAFAGT